MLFDEHERGPSGNLALQLEAIDQMPDDEQMVIREVTGGQRNIGQRASINYSDPFDCFGRNAESDFHGEKRLNKTHESRSDPESRNYKKSKNGEAKMAYLGHTVIENRNGLIVKTKASLADGYGERKTAIDMLAELPGEHQKTVGADKNYDTRDFVASCRSMKITPHFARNDKRKGGSAIDARTSRHEGYKISMKVRKRVEEPFGWGKTVGLIRQVKVRGLDRVNAALTMTFIG